MPLLSLSSKTAGDSKNLEAYKVTNDLCVFDIPLLAICKYDKSCISIFTVSTFSSVMQCKALHFLHKYKISLRRYVIKAQLHLKSKCQRIFFSLYFTVESTQTLWFAVNFTLSTWTALTTAADFLFGLLKPRFKWLIQSYRKIKFWISNVSVVISWSTFTFILHY